MNDLTGAGKIAEVIVTALSKVSGTLYQPTKIEREARAKAKALLIQTEAEILAEKLRSTEIELVENDNDALLQKRAGQRVLSVEVARQQNIERITRESLKLANPVAEPRDLESDWMSAFLRYAQDISADGVRELWSKILATQATEDEPAVSRATLDAMRLFEPKHALHFERAVQLHVGIGAILDTQPTESLNYSFNVNDLLAMALEDIGFLRRTNEQETSLALQDYTLTFWSPTEIIGTTWSEATQKDISGLLTHIRSATESEHTSGDRSGRKAIRLSQMQLTSRGFELTAVIHPQIYAGMSGDRDTRDASEFGALADADIREAIVTEWSQDFSSLGAFVVRNKRAPKSGKDLVPIDYFDSIKGNWCQIS